MKCFNHEEREAVAICKYCKKGVCKECAAETEFGISCKGKCEEEVITMKKVAEYNKKFVLNRDKDMTEANKKLNQTYRKMARVHYGSAIILFIIALAIVGIVYLDAVPKVAIPSLILCAIVAIFWGVIKLSVGRKLNE